MIYLKIDIEIEAHGARPQLCSRASGSGRLRKTELADLYVAIDCTGVHLKDCWPSSNI